MGRNSSDKDMKIVHERDKCIGCGSCAAICPDFWEMAEDGKSFLKNSTVNPQTGYPERSLGKIGCNEEAVNVCPVNCIKIEKS